MAAKKKVTKVITKRRRSPARANAKTSPPAAPTCPKCGRELQPGEDPAAGPCIRCQHEAAFPGRDWDTDAQAAEARGIRLSSYMREQLTGLADGRPKRGD